MHESNGTIFYKIPNLEGISSNIIESSYFAPTFICDLTSYRLNCSSVPSFSFSLKIKVIIKRNNVNTIPFDF